MHDPEPRSPVGIDTLPRRAKNIIENLHEIAYAHNGVSGAKVAACIAYGNKVISYGLNSRKTHPLQKKWGRNIQAIAIHAEIDAIKNALRHIDVEELKHTTLYVARSKKDGSYGLAKPCIGPDGCGCQSAIAAFGIQRVIWTTDNNGMVEGMF